MRQIRTDLAYEAYEAMGDEGMPGVHVNHWETMGVTLTEVVLDGEDAAKKLGKVCGNYLTLECAGILTHDADARIAMANILGEELARMIKRHDDAPVMVVGLGNRDITPDSLGPLAVDGTLVTRHMFRELPQYTNKRMHSVCAIAPGVLGVTGFETGEVVESLVKAIRPQTVICIDSLSARAAERIGATVQLTDTGIRPGSGVGNHRRALTKEELGVDVIAIGMPTVIYAATLARDAMALLSGNQSAQEQDDAFDQVENELLEGPLGEMIVTPREVDSLIADAALIIAAGINKALQPELTDEEIFAMMN